MEVTENAWCTFLHAERLLQRISPGEMSTALSVHAEPKELEAVLKELLPPVIYENFLNWESHYMLEGLSEMANAIRTMKHDGTITVKKDEKEGGNEGAGTGSVRGKPGSM